MARRERLTRREKRELDIEIGFLEGLVRRDPTWIEALQLLAEDYTRRGRYRDGLRIDQRLAQLRPGDPTILYNLACSYSLVGDQEKAYETLCQALDHGYRDFRWLAEDPDLEAFRRHPLYQRLKRRIRRLRRAYHFPPEKT